MRVLIVDDDRVSRALVRAVVDDEGHFAIEADSAEEAIPTIAAGEVDVVITDWQMAGMSGPELATYVRAAALDRYVYVILLTANNNPESLITGLNSGADDFVTKPFNLEELAVRLRVAQRVTALETRDLTIFSLAKLAESRDPETGAHLERVRNYCKLIATAMARNPRFSLVVTPSFIRLMYLTSPLHDIGKVGIPDAVLLKPGRLDEREYAIMKQHAQIGADTLGDALKMYPNAEFLRMARDIALTHHEQWDGSGYPNSLRGEEIPLAGRIMAVADVYDALRSRRVYKPAHEHHVARDIILNARGTHFDPCVIDAFLACEAEVCAVADRFGEHRAHPNAPSTTHSVAPSIAA